MNGLSVFLVELLLLFYLNSFSLPLEHGFSKLITLLINVIQLQLFITFLLKSHLTYLYFFILSDFTVRFNEIVNNWRRVGNAVTKLCLLFCLLLQLCFCRHFIMRTNAHIRTCKLMIFCRMSKLLWDLYVLVRFSFVHFATNYAT